MPTRHLLLIAVLAAARVAGAQDPLPGTDLPTDARSPIKTGTRRFVAIPVLRSTPTLGTGAGGVGALLFRVDSTSTPSSIGIGGLYTDSQSWMFAMASRVYFHSDRWNAAGGLALFDLHYDFFGVGTAAGKRDQSIPIAQRGDAEIVEGLRRLPHSIFLGPRYLHRGITTTLEGKDVTDPLAQLAMHDNDYNLSALGAAAVFDTRDDEYAPRHGTQAQLSAMLSRYGLGSDFSYDFYRGSINQYIALTSRSVLALRAVGCNVGSAAPSWELCLYGTGPDLRGYAGGRYRDRSMFATQGELRSSVSGRMDAVFFGGVGGVGRSLSGISGDALLPSGGGGLRYLVWETYHIKVGAEYAWGKDGGAFYLRLGEAF